MFFEGTGRVPGVWDADVAEWQWGVGEPTDPDGALLGAIEEDLGWDAETLPTYVVGDDTVFDSELSELLAECELALESAARDDVDLALVGGWVR